MNAWNAWNRACHSGDPTARCGREPVARGPPGLLSGLAIPPLRKGALPVRMILAAIVVAFVFFWGTLVELGQFWFGGRVPSFSDTIAQTIGGILGVVACLIGGNWFLSRVGAFVFHRREEQTASIALELYLAGYAAWD